MSRSPIPRLDRESSTPIYRQVEAYLRGQIDRGRYGPGDMLPSVKALCEEFGGLNHLTVRQALKNMIDAGMVESIRGRGTFVRKGRAKAGRVALVVPTLEDVLNTRISQGVQNVLGAAAFRTIVMDSRSDPAEELANIRQLEDLPLDGAIIFPVKYGSVFEEIYRLKIDRFPFVLIDRYFYDADVPSVVVDNYRGAYDLTAHLAATGRKRVAWVGEGGFSSAQDRFQGYCDALNEAGLCYRRSMIRRVGDPRAATISLLKESPRPEAIVYLNDVSALAGLEVIRRAGLRVPKEIAVTGFDDIPAAALAEPGLTTVRQPMEQLGVEAARLLIAMFAEPNLPARRVVLPVEMVIRGSA